MRTAARETHVSPTRLPTREAATTDNGRKTECSFWMAQRTTPSSVCFIIGLSHPSRSCWRGSRQHVPLPGHTPPRAPRREPVSEACTAHRMFAGQEAACLSASEVIVCPPVLFLEATPLTGTQSPSVCSWEVQCSWFAGGDCSGFKDTCVPEGADTRPERPWHSVTRTHVPPPDSLLIHYKLSVSFQESKE